MIKFNQQQLDIINSVNTNTMVSASAGAGKTTVLIGRFIKRILEDGLSIDQIAAMTFTEKAAAEMKNRLAEALGKKLQENPEDPLLKKQFTLLASAQISTIHSFCLSIIKEFGYLKGIDPVRTSNILDDQVIATLQQKASNQVVDELVSLYKDNQTFIQLLDFFTFRITNTDDFQKAFIKLSNTAQSTLDAEVYFDNLSTLYSSTSFDEYPNEIKEQFFSYASVLILKMSDYLDAMENAYLESEKQKEEFYNQLQDHREMIEIILTALKNKDLNDARKHLTQLLSSKMVETRSTSYSSMRKEYFSNLGANAYEFMRHETNLSLSQPYISLLIQAARRYHELFSNLKLEAKGLDFDDIEKLAYELVSFPKENNLVIESLKQRYEEIMVDEFQDSNEFQNAIINSISRGNNVFRVGDVKQSIYGFRNAKPAIMKGIMELDGQPNHKTLYLSKNFRSSYNIVEFNNILFKNLMNIEGSGLSFDDLDRVDIGLEKQKDNDQKVEIVLLDPKQEVEYQGYYPPKILNPLRSAYFIAQDIVEKVAQNKFDYKDICILIRSHGRKTDLKKAFDDYQIPYYIEDREGFYHAFSVQDVTHFLKFTLNPQDNINLTWVLLSGFVNYTEQQLSELHLINPNKSYFDNLKVYDVVLYEKLKTLISLQRQLSPLNFLLQLIHFNDYYRVHCDSQQRTNLDLLLQRYETYLSKNNQGVIGFLDQIEHALTLESSNASNISEEDNVVRVMTIHQSKGLEYPLVYFMSFKSSNRDQDLKGKIAYDSELGITIGKIDYDNNTKDAFLFDQYFNTKKQINSISEEIRNLYVALTRPKHHLMIVDIYSDKNDYSKIGLSDLVSGDNYIKLILKSLVNEKQETFEIHNMVQLKPIIPLKPKSKPIKSVESLPVLMNEPIEKIESQRELTLTLNLNSRGGTDYGTMVHELMEKLPHRLLFEDELNQYSESLSTKIRLFNTNPLTQEFYQRQIQHEVPLAFKQESGLFYGYMDMLVFEDDTITMVDFKTDLIETAEDIKNRYAVQMNTYLTGLAQLYPNKKIKGYLYSFDLNQYIEL